MVLLQVEIKSCPRSEDQTLIIDSSGGRKPLKSPFCWIKSQ